MHKPVLGVVSLVIDSHSSGPRASMVTFGPVLKLVFDYLVP